MEPSKLLHDFVVTFEAFRSLRRTSLMAEGSRLTMIMTFSDTITFSQITVPILAFVHNVAAKDMQDIDVAAFLQAADEIGGTLPKETAPLLASMHAEVSLSHVSKQVVEGKEVDLIALTGTLVKAKLAVAPVATDHNFKTMVRSATDKWQKIWKE